MEMNRRKFLKVGGMAGLLAAFSPMALLKLKEAEGVRPIAYGDTSAINELNRTNILLMDDENVGSIANVSVTQAPREYIDITELGDREYLPSFPMELGRIDLELFYSISSYDLLRRGFEDGKTHDFKLHLVGERTEFCFTGNIILLDRVSTVDREQQVLQSMTIELTTPVLYGA